MMANNITELAKKVPVEIYGWKKSAEDTLYNSENLFEYIDGLAELYISYSFNQMVALKYIKEGSNEIVVDIFDMGNSFNAFGVFSHSSETPDNLIGQGSEYASGLLTFWKDKYYVSVLTYPETEEKKRIILKIGQDIANAIKKEGPLPPIISLLPEENLVNESIRYFHHHVWLNSHYFITDQNILHIDHETDALLAKYSDKQGNFFALLVTYPGKGKAEEALKTFLKHYLPDAQEGIKKLEDNRWTGCKLEENLIIVVFNAPTNDSVKHFFEKIKFNEL